jgi:hypothetical protein
MSDGVGDIVFWERPPVGEYSFIGLPRDDNAGKVRLAQLRARGIVGLTAAASREHIDMRDRRVNRSQHEQRRKFGQITPPVAQVLKR